MPNGFVNLQAELIPCKNQCSKLFRALRCRVQRRSFPRNHWRMLHQLQRLDQFVAFQRVLPAKAVRIGTLLNFPALERRCSNTASRNHLALVNPGPDAGRKPRINLAKLHVGFCQRDALHFAHFGIRGQQQGKLCLQGNL